MAIVSSSVGPRYQVQYSPHLANASGENFGNTQPGTGNELQIVMPGVLSGAKGFYRILISR